ncbi:toll/interleukin-1 receptor domain-containing protein [Nodosilinea sp. P-1105]|nr:toll/interleukin-1 receptor domain-containing protein [Nodosilinea sp. P-1105]
MCAYSQGYPGNSAGFKLFVNLRDRRKTWCIQLKSFGFSVWVDWEDIPPGSDWKRVILEGIISSNNLVFIISPDSVKSGFLENDVENAARFGKRIIPIYYRFTTEILRVRKFTQLSEKGIGYFSWRI